MCLATAKSGYRKTYFSLNASKNNWLLLIRQHALEFFATAPCSHNTPRSNFIEECQALRGFQKAKGLRPTGEPDTATLDALGLR